MAAFTLRSCYAAAFLVLFLIPLFSHAIVHKNKIPPFPYLSQNHPSPKVGKIKEDSFAEFFEVSPPIDVPSTQPCSFLLLQHRFGNTLKKPPASALYTPPPASSPCRNFSMAVLEWKASCKGRQFDRIFGVWLGGAELLRSCTAEPSRRGVRWAVKKDITRYASLLAAPQTLAVFLGNIVNRNYTGIYHVQIFFHFYPAAEGSIPTAKPLGYAAASNSPADLVLPISRSLPLDDGQWFVIDNQTDAQDKQIQLPPNIYRAVLEVYVSFHGNDESWYANPPDEYLTANQLTDLPGNGPFREVLVGVDDRHVGAIWPFTVVYTGGINPLLWRPITGIGSFDLPSYDLELTPLLGDLLDGKNHTFTFSITNALNFWYVDANLHLWLDPMSMKTSGRRIEHNSPPPLFRSASKFEALNGEFLTQENRCFSSAGWVASSHGNITLKSTQILGFQNRMVFAEDGGWQIVNQSIESYSALSATNQSGADAYSNEIHQNFLFHLSEKDNDLGNGILSSFANVSMGFKEMRHSNISGSEFYFSSLRNNQKGQGEMIVKEEMMQKGLGSTQQELELVSTHGCYSRKVASLNYTVLYDEIHGRC